MITGRPLPKLVVPAYETRIVAVWLATTALRFRVAKVENQEIVGPTAEQLSPTRGCARRHPDRLDGSEGCL